MKFSFFGFHLYSACGNYTLRHFNLQKGILKQEGHDGP